LSCATGLPDVGQPDPAAADQGKDMRFRLVRPPAGSPRKGIHSVLPGGKAGVRPEGRGNLIRKHPEVRIVGVYSPFGFEKDDRENQKVVDLIRSARPDILLVGLGHPQTGKMDQRILPKSRRAP